MTTRVSSTAAAIFGGLLTALALFAFTGPSASGQQAAAETKTEYTVVTIDANTLSAKVTELAGQGWDVVTITVLEAKVDGGGATPKVITEKYDVTCRRTVKK